MRNLIFSILASYLHINFFGNEDLAEKFLS